MHAETNLEGSLCRRLPSGALCAVIAILSDEAQVVLTTSQAGSTVVPLTDASWIEAPGDLISGFDVARSYWVSTAELEPHSGRLTQAAREHVARALVGAEVGRFLAVASASNPKFRAGHDRVPVTAKVIGAPEIKYAVDAALDGWFTTGRFNARFERELSAFLGVRFVLTTNSGSSANLLALASLTSPLLEERALRPGDEVITVAAGFPTTVNPAFQLGLVPVFVDVILPTYQVDVSALEAALSPRTRAIMLAHTLGNPFDLDAVSAFARRHGLWLVEDCCDALGSEYCGRRVGSFGDVGTLSFYPAHHITMGEGGAVFTRHGVLQRALQSIRDWGRDCWCEPGKDNTCGKRFEWRLGDLPEGYDHKYIYSHLGYNLKITDMQAAIGCAQLQRLEGFIQRRKENFAYLRQELAPLANQLILPDPTPDSDPAWFGFPITLRPGAPSRTAVVRHLEAEGIATRLLFAGNLLRQPYMQGRQYRAIGDLPVTNSIADRTFWVGIHPGLGQAQLHHICSATASATLGVAPNEGTNAAGTTSQVLHSTA